MTRSAFLRTLYSSGATPRTTSPSLDAFDLHHVVGAAPAEERADACRDQAAAGLLAHHQHVQLAAVEPLALARSADVDAVAIVADEQQGRVDPPGPLLIDRQRQAM